MKELKEKFAEDPEADAADAAHRPRGHRRHALQLAPHHHVQPQRVHRDLHHGCWVRAVCAGLRVEHVQDAAASGAHGATEHSREPDERVVRMCTRHAGDPYHLRDVDHDWRSRAAALHSSPQPTQLAFEIVLSAAVIAFGT